MNSTLHNARWYQVVETSQNWVFRSEHDGINGTILTVKCFSLHALCSWELSSGLRKSHLTFSQPEEIETYIFCEKADGQPCYYIKHVMTHAVQWAVDNLTGSAPYLLAMTRSRSEPCMHSNTRVFRGIMKSRVYTNSASMIGTVVRKFAMQFTTYSVQLRLPHSTTTLGLLLSTSIA